MFCSKNASHHPPSSLKFSFTPPSLKSFGEKFRKTFRNSKSNFNCSINSLTIGIHRFQMVPVDFAGFAVGKFGFGYSHLECLVRFSQGAAGVPIERAAQVSGRDIGYV